MKASELVSQLEHCIETFGDLPCMVFNKEGLKPRFTKGIILSLDEDEKPIGFCIGDTEPLAFREGY